eukprot:CAMPEP_0181307348 /NCGR_PEP_ID=MMETSP1101-20121128/10827_1 /TAXON_ID=46948 /ORGANISM="Rhodomonas abbreviata, Strain Caron Lab Isolate" /LENGTH=62 /DNA_ID=CAMNT_0023413549 /DNA_START=79 /DNA_END=263 /DNA_ORIENTATION=-
MPPRRAPDDETAALTLEQRLERMEAALQEERAQLAEDRKEVTRQLQELASKRKRDDGDDEEG